MLKVKATRIPICKRKNIMLKWIGSGKDPGRLSLKSLMNNTSQDSNLLMGLQFFLFNKENETQELNNLCFLHPGQKSTFADSVFDP